MKLISIVVPTYNEEAGITHFLEVLFDNLNKLNNYQFEVILVNDGSSDKTYQIEQSLQFKYPNIVLVNLSRNFGHESAIAAGLSVTKGDAVIPLDADLQDPPEVIGDLLLKFEEGYDVVNAKRNTREGESRFKKRSAKLFYRLIAKLSGKVKIPENVGHFRLMSRRVVDKINELKDAVRVLRVEVPYLGYKTTEVCFDRKSRVYGKTHYNLDAMENLALDSIVSTTGKPLKIITHFFFFFFATTLLSSIIELILYIISVCNVPLNITRFGFLGWLIINVILLIATLLFFSLALISEYISRLYLEAQNRPFYIIESIKRKE